jgi:hypothetical protein
VIIIHAVMPTLPISALLSQTLVAFTIEFDNEAERRMPHRTTGYGPSGVTPCPECWRARVPAPSVLPHFPMVLHRGGYPDGA